MLLIIGARITQKYGGSQLNVNPHEGKAVLNPSHTDYTLPVNPEPKPAVAKKPLVNPVATTATMALIRELTDESSIKKTVYLLQAQVKQILNPCHEMTYAACPECFAKMPETQAKTLTGMVECPKCKKIVALIHAYFFRCQVYDATGQIEVGFAREFAVELMDGMDP